MPRGPRRLRFLCTRSNPHLIGERNALQGTGGSRPSSICTHQTRVSRQPTWGPRSLQSVPEVTSPCHHDSACILVESCCRKHGCHREPKCKNWEVRDQDSFGIVDDTRTRADNKYSTSKVAYGLCTVLHNPIDTTLTHNFSEINPLTCDTKRIHSAMARKTSATG
ncbi:hypothetical protein PISMIDRAFT_478748 [Pisolithus microcarpus 441]|uniref:Uncharacterized protein n=1 Tax=Pisolithus microcarpus 441 TaxID=765257 RepID=A0A0C9YUT3_9AGAM|nr:hypothetical protein PISMIDRAFT_478748 [Pisolithus microcarpus 441]